MSIKESFTIWNNELFQYALSPNDKLNNIFSKDSTKYCATRDVFSARLNNFYQQVLNSLLVAVCGEIGNNSFDHNIGKWKGMPGLYFDFYQNNIVTMMDVGVGIKETLSQVTSVTTDLEALELAFTKTISGRAPEQRGNGLKFVASSVVKENWKLYYRTGDAICLINNGKITFEQSSDYTFGCIASLAYGGK